VLERVPDTNGLLTAGPHGALLAEQRGWLKRGVDDAAAAVHYSHADATAAVPGLHGHHVRRTAHARRHRRLNAAGFFVPFSVGKTKRNEKLDILSYRLSAPKSNTMITGNVTETYNNYIIS